MKLELSDEWYQKHLIEDEDEEDCNINNLNIIKMKEVKDVVNESTSR